MASEFSSLSSSFSRSVEAVITGIFQCERLAVQWDTHNDFGSISSTTDPVIECVLCVEISHICLRMEAKWSHMACSLVPMAVIIVSHDTDPIQVTRQRRDVITSIDNGFGW